MNKLGICSITFRDLSVQELITEVKKADLSAIEWGADVHVPPNNIKNAKKVARLTREAGLVVPSYGSYYRVGIENEHSFEDVLKTAVILDVKDIRVWAGRMGSVEADEEYFDAVVEDSKRISKLAKEYGIRISYEFHRKTLTDTIESTLRLLEAVADENVRLYWQPSIGLPKDARIANIKEIGKYITNIHVFQWKGIDRLPLEDGIVEWSEYIKTINEHSPNQNYYLLEFVKDDNLEQFYTDAKTLKKLF